MDIFLVRHGEAAAAWGTDPDPGLSALGREQALDSSALLLPKLDAQVNLISSPLLRAQETAEPYLQALGGRLVVNEAFREVPAPVPVEQRQTWLREFMQQRWSEQPEALVSWRGRILDQLRTLQSPTVIFTHFLVLNAVVGDILARDETLHYWPANASVTHLSLVNNSLELVELGVQMESVVN